jgi:2-phospho-L-lactate guanylyltransferase
MRKPQWSVVVPVKRLDRAKTRLRGALPGVPHDRLVLAMAMDTVRAAVASRLVSRVLVVTDDPLARAELTSLGARPVPDPGSGLNGAVAFGAAQLVGGWVAALAADLPALRPSELTSALVAATAAVRRCFVPDAPGTGTTLLAAPPGAALDPRFGPGSAAAHAGSGARRLEGTWPSLRRDVDTAADLAEAARLGLGPSTAARAAVPAG